MRYVLFDTEEGYADLLPISFTRPVAEFRLGMLTIRRKWETRLPGDYIFWPVDYLATKYGTCPDDDVESIFISGSVLPDSTLTAVIEGLQRGEALTYKDSEGGVQLLAYRGLKGDFDGRRLREEIKTKPLEIAGYEPRTLKFVFDIFRHNDAEIRSDYQLLTEGRISRPLPESCRVIGGTPDPESPSGYKEIFLEEGAKIECAILNVSEGPIYIGREATVMEGACLRAPLAICRKATVKMGAKIYGGTTLGPWCKVGGELSNVVMFGYSNKAHDGYLGNAVIGEWCNLGAGVNASNLKNDYSKIRIWNYPRHTFMRTDLQFCGLIMGEHSKAGINVMFNTATVVGVGCNLHGAGFPRVFVPSFTEGSPSGGMSDVGMKKFYQIAERVMSRRGIALEEGDRIIYERVYEVASKYKW